MAETVQVPEGTVIVEVPQKAIEMKERLQQELGSIIDWLKDTGEVAGDFVQEQAPLLVEEIVKAGILDAGKETALWILGTIILAFCTCKLLRIFEKYKQNSEYPALAEDWEAGKWVVRVCGVFLGSCFVICAVDAFFDVIRIVIAPRLYIIEKLTSLF